MTAIRKALGLPELVEFQGQTWPLEPLTFLDLADAEALGLLPGGNPENLNPTSILWLMLRKADPALTETQRDLCQYTMTPRQARSLFVLQGETAREGIEFMTKVIEASGMNATDEEQPDAPAAAEAAPKKARGAREYKTAAAPTTPSAE